MTIQTYNQKGEIIGKTSLPKEIFGIPMNSDLVYQVAVSQMSNKRQGSSKAKDRSEKRGGGKKPWRQKGTGRARHGSIRSPIWRGGGVTFGPVAEKNLKKKINKKTKRKALFMVLSSKVKDNSFIVLETMEIKEPKTKTMRNILDNLKLKNNSVLIATPVKTKDNPVFLSARNIPRVAISPISDINALDLLSFKYLIISKDGIKTIKQLFLKEE